MQTGGRQSGRRAMRVPSWPPEAPADGAGREAQQRYARDDDGAYGYDERDGQYDQRRYAQRRSDYRDDEYGYRRTERQSDYRDDEDGYRRTERRNDYRANEYSNRRTERQSDYHANEDGYRRTERRSDYRDDEDGYRRTERQSDYRDDEDGYRRTERRNDYRANEYSNRRTERQSDYRDDEDGYRRTERRSDYRDDEYGYRRTERQSDYRANEYSNRRAERRNDYRSDEYGNDFADENDQDYGHDFDDGAGREYVRARRRRDAGPGALERMADAARGMFGNMSRKAWERRAMRNAGVEQRGDARDEGSAVFGGREHDNIHAADARPGVGRGPIIAMVLAMVLLVVIVPMLVQAWNRRAALGGNAISAQSAAGAGVSITAQPGSVIPTATPAPTATPEPDAAQAAAPEATASGLIVSQYTGRTLDRGRPAVALTFDDGPSDQTMRILDALEANGGLGTFFLLGERVDSGEYADALRRQREMGCLVGTHMYSHTKLTELTADQIAQELSRCVAAHQNAGGDAPQIARAPYGQVSDEVLSVLDMPLINWSLNSNDWQTQNADRIYNDVMNAVQDGDMIMFHDMKDFTAEALERIAPALTAQGYQLVTVQELFELKGQTLEPGRLYAERVVAVGA